MFPFKCLICLGFSSIFFFYAIISTQFVSINFSYSSEHERTSAAIDETSLFSKCVLAEFDKDGWTKDVIEEAEVDYDPIRKCDETFMPFTVLGDNETVWLNRKKKGVDEVTCWARAIYYQDEWYLNTSEWHPIERAATKIKFNSDFAHTSCKKKVDVSEVVEDFIHLQMWNASDYEGGKGTSKSHKQKEQKEADIDEKPNVFIFVLDSVANSQALRSLPKTISLLQHEFDAVNLRHVNKVGENSHPNGIAFLFGKLITDIDRSIFGMGKERADWNESFACHRFLDNEPFILKEFAKKGYKSLMAEDWASGVFNYPDCWGFEAPPATHYMRPFQIYNEQSLESRLLMGENQCFESHTFLFNYLTKFIKAYNESPKISLLWASEIAHDNNDGLFHVDGQLFDFFREHRKTLDMSYVFLMGDHGMRFGKASDMVRNTWIGEREINNPMMFVSVPRHLRERISPVLRENSNRLLTSFDIYASLVDILNDPHLNGVAETGGLRGSSFFRSLPPGERSCRTLPIPIQFCLCEWNKTKSEDARVNDVIGRRAMKLLNKKLQELQIDKTCEKYTFNKTKEVKMIDHSDGLADIIFTVNECGAEFKTIVRARRSVNGHLNVSLAANHFIRWNSYGHSTECMKTRASLRPLCCCRDRDQMAI